MARKMMLVLFLALLSSQAVFAAGSNLLSMHFASKGQAVQMTIVLSQPAAWQIFHLAHPQRIVLDFKNTHLKTTLQHSGYDAAGIRNVRVGYPHTNVLRIVLDLPSKTAYRVLSPAGSKRIQIAIMQKKMPTRLSTSKPVAQTVTVVIDPGHGGHDPGAIGVAGTQEKTVVLAIARQLARQINQTPHMRAVLTRSGDYFVPLRGRIALAHRGKATLFVAIHADSWFARDAKGASVFALSQHGATSEAARWLAGRENYSELAGVDFRSLPDQSDLLRSVMIDLAQTATIRDSLFLGHALLSQLKNVSGLHYRHVEQAPFVVLKSPDIPSILVETGFLSSRQEEQHLRDPLYQAKIARALYVGIQDFLKKHPSAVS